MIIRFLKDELVKVTDDKLNVSHKFLLVTFFSESLLKRTPG